MNLPSGFPAQIPSLYVQNEGEDVSTKVALTLTRAPEKFVIRLTGGCGEMSERDAEPMYDLFTHGFGGDYKGALVFGGTQMRLRADPSMVYPGITEIAPRIASECPEAIVLGIVPRQGDLKLSPHGMIVSDELGKDFFTIVHPQQHTCLVVQHSVDTGVIWDAEYLICASIVQHLQDFAGWKALLVAYNGGGVTEREIMLWAQRGWPVLLIAESGRVSERLAKDSEFLRLHPSVHVAENYAPALRLKLTELGAVKPTRANIRLVNSST